MTEQEANVPSVLISPEMCDVLDELAVEKGMDSETVMRQYRLIMGQLSIEAAKE